MNSPRTPLQAGVHQILKDVQANQQKLEQCPKHKFKTPQPPLLLGMKLECIHCGGKLGLAGIGWYLRGYQAAGGDPNDIVEGWYGSKFDEDNEG